MPSKVLGTAMGVLKVTTTACASDTGAANAATATAHKPRRDAMAVGLKEPEFFMFMLDPYP